MEETKTPGSQNPVVPTSAPEVTPNPLTPPTEQVPLETQPTQPETTHGSRLKYVLFALIAVFVLTAGIILLLLRLTPKQSPQQVVAKPITTVTPIPSLAPITAKNADQTLGNTDKDIEQALNQVDTDTNQLNQTDSTQDTPTDL